MLTQVLVCILAALVTYWLLPSTDLFDPASIQGKKVLVTGASSGIGEEIAYHYARLGASVVITARREELLKKVTQQCKELGHPDAKFGYVAADMAKVDDTKMVIEKAVQMLGGLDHLLLNHGVYDSPGFWYGTEDDLRSFERLLQVNFVSFVRLTSHALPHLERSGSAAIGVVSSAAGKLPLVFHAGYSASTFAMDGFFGSLGQELRLAKLNVTTTLCVIGMTGTAKADEVADILQDKINFDVAAMLKWVALGDPKETAWAILRSTALGEHELYYPPGQHGKLLVHIRHLFPSVLDNMAEMYASEAARKQPGKHMN